MISKLGSRRSASPVAPATGFGRVIPARVRPQTSKTYYHRNQQYSIVGLANAAGTLVERCTYSAYGTFGIYAANGTVRSSSTYANRYTYTGREWDADLRLYHFRARWYDPATGGFVTRDPLGYVDGMSLYRGYFGVKNVDPTGEAIPLLPICAVACIGSYFCISPCASTCCDIEVQNARKRNQPFFPEGWAKCTLDCLILMPWYGKIVCGGVSCGCMACLVKEAGKLIQKSDKLNEGGGNAGRPGYKKQ